jgi:RNA polymerase sigma-70 factor (ECF subfamily)
MSIALQSSGRSENVMPATANARRRNTATQSLAPHTMQKRRSFRESVRSISESAFGKPASLISARDDNNLTEAEIIKRAQSGDEAMFEQLYRRHSRRVYAVCVRMVKDPVEAEDLTQEAFMLLFRKLHTFRGESAFSTWLYRLAVNRVLMRLRKKSLPAVSLDEPLDPNEPNGPVIDPGSRDSILEGLLDRINLERCIRRLPTGYRTIFVLHDVQGFKHHEIAEILGRSVGDSKSQLHKARAQLRVLLHEMQRVKARDRRLAAKVSPGEMCPSARDPGCRKVREERLLRAAERPAV